MSNPSLHETVIEAEIIGIHEDIKHNLFYMIWRDFVLRNMQGNKNICKSTKQAIVY